MTVTARAPSHDADEEPRPRSRGRALSIVVASLGTLAIIVALLLTSRGPATQEVQSIPAQPNTARVAAPAQPSFAQPVPGKPAPLPAPVPALPAVPAEAPVAMPMDSRGFIDSAARCDADQSAVAVARTERAAIAVCRDGDEYTYRGVRLRDGAALRLDDVRLIPAGFEARNDTTTYRLTNTELVVIDGEALQSRDRVVEYRAG